MTLRGGMRRICNPARGRLSGWARAAAAALLGIVVAASSASAQEALVLSPTPAKDGGVDLVVRGARPRELVQLIVDASPDPGPTSRLYGDPQQADVLGIARFSFAADEIANAGGDLFAQALTSDLRSNVISLREVPALYLLVDEAEASTRVLRFDPTRGTLAPQLVRLDSDSVLSFARYLPVAARGGSLIRSGQDPTALAGAPLHSGERPIDLISWFDQSTLLALTREDLPQGRAVIRLRLIETNPRTHEIASIEIQRDGGRLVSAWLVSDVDSRRALIAERDGTIREVVLGAEPGRGVTILPLAPQSSEELLDVKIHDNQVVVVTHPGPMRSRRSNASRMLVFDLDERGDPVETVLDAAALGFEVVERPDGPAAFIALDSGQVEVVPLDPSHPRVLLSIPDVRRISPGPDGSLFTLQTRGDAASVARIDAETLAVDPVALDGLKGSATRVGVFGGLVDRVRRTWLYVVQQQPQTGSETADDELLYAELDPADDHPTGAFVVPLGGHVRRVANR